MKLSFKNVGKVAKAEMELGLITVIAGANDTGKSTVGKILYSIYTALSELTPEKMLRNKIEAILSDVKKIQFFIGYSDSKFAENVRYFNLDVNPTDDLDEHEKCLDLHIKGWVKMSKEILKGEKISEHTKKKIEKTFQDMLLKADLKINSKDIQLLRVRDELLSEFSGSLTTVLCASAQAEIILEKSKENKMKLEFLANEIDETQSYIEKTREFSKAIYIDDPFILDDLNTQRRKMKSDSSYNHNDMLIDLIEQKSEINYFEKVLENKKIREILDEIVEGRIFRKGSRYQYQNKKMLTPVDIESLSTGMKSFAILKMLFDSQKLDKCEFLILDEPEIHLHPEWQLKYAELIVILAKEYPFRVLITSHSPYFIEAIELYSREHHIDDEVRYYKTQSAQKEMSEIVNVTDKLEDLYEDLVQPFRVWRDLEDTLNER